MTDLEDRLERAGVAWRAAQPAVAPRSRPRSRTALPRWAPLAAAAAVVAVAAGSVLLVQHGREVVAATGPDGLRVVAVVPAGAPTPAGPDDAPAPAERLFTVTPPQAPALEPCRADRLTAALTLRDGTGTLSLNAGEGQLCVLPADVSPRLTIGADTLPASYPQQPPVVNPPRQRPVAGSLTAGVRWASWCGPRDGTLTLGGVAGAPVSVHLAGDLPPCKSATAVFVLSRFGTGPGGAAVVPVDRAGLQVRLEMPARVEAGPLVDYRVRIANPTSRPISLRPCPTYTVDLAFRGRLPGGTKAAGTDGLLPCPSLPAQLGSHEEVVVGLSADLVEADRGRTGNEFTGDVLWGIAGTPGARTTLAVHYPEPPAPLAVAPWTDTEAGNPSPRGTDPYQVGSVLQGLPATVRPGELLRYRVLLFNDAYGRSLALRPCPGYSQALDLPGQVGPVSRLLNCAALPAALPGGQAVVLDMQLRLPADLPTGTVTLTWDLGGRASSKANLMVARR